MVICPQCKSINVRVANGNFARTKGEGQPSAKHSYTKLLFHCWDCEHNWESTPEAEKDYFEYVHLRSRTEIAAGDLGKDGSYQVGPTIDSGETSRRIEYEYSATPFYQQKLNNIRIEFCYEDENGFPFSSGRALGSQEHKQDGMFRFPAGKGKEYLEG